MPSRARSSQLAKARLALKVALDEEARASSVLAAPGQLSPFAVTVDERDALVELQLAAHGFTEAIRQGVDCEDKVVRFFEASRAFEMAWAASSSALG